jgi:hypothetical protein
VVLPTLLPRPLVASTCAAVAIVLAVALVPPGQGVPPFVVRIAELLLAGGAAYALDDAASVLTEVTPQRPWQRRAPVLGASAVLLAAAWAAVLLVLHWQQSLPSVLASSLELLVLALLTLAAAAALVWSGDPEPGTTVSPLVAVLGLGALIAEPLTGTIVFPTSAAPVGTGLAIAWVATGVAALLVLVLASRDPAGRRTGVRRLR